jgi:hypothetical protein
VLTACVALAWFALIVLAIAATAGLEPIAFFSPDEAVNRLAGSLVSRTGRPFLELPFPDPENAAHPRLWFSLGARAVPLYPPVSLFVYGLLTYLGTPGFLLVIMLPASGVAAFSAGVARLLPPRRRWLAALAPALPAPTLYWFVRPWMNIAPLLVGVGWAFYAWTHWRERGRVGWLAALFACIGAGAAVRPDYTAYLLLATLCFSAAARPADWRSLVIASATAGGGALLVNLPLNKLITGHAFLAAYQLVLEPTQGTPTPLWLRLPRLLLFPIGLPAPSTIVPMFVKYWLALGSVAALLVAQLAWFPLFRREPRHSLSLWLGGALVVIVFMISRMDPDTFGAMRDTPMVLDSIPRYWSPVYLLAAVPPLVYVGRSERRAVFGAGTALLAIVALFAVREAWFDAAQCLATSPSLVRNSARRFKELDRYVGRNAIVYTLGFDKLIWSKVRVGSVEEPAKAAKSMERALDRGMDVFLYLDVGEERQVTLVEQSLERAHFERLAAVQRVRLYRLRR